MLNEYIEEQSIASQILINTIKNKKVSHAYLFETNGYYQSENFVLAFVKQLLCPTQSENFNQCKNCYQCQNIDKHIFSEVKHIYPDGMWIKKDQLKELKKELNETSIESKKRIYIIHEAEKLNLSASNSILKFLEEPEANIIAILITNNRHQLLETIISRCQIISLKRVSKNIENNLEKYFESNLEFLELNEEEKLEKIKHAIDFLLLMEKNKLNSVLYTQKKFHAFFETKNEIMFFLDLANLFYLEIMKIKLNQPIKLFLDYKNQMNNISDQNEMETINKKIQIITLMKQQIKFNVNSHLFIDKMIIEMEGEI